MSGHSKWSTIKHKKAIRDHARGDLFTKAVHNITVAVRTGGSSDQNTNFALRLAIEQAKAVNLPKDKIARAIAVASGGGGGSDIEELTLEGYGSGGKGILVEVVTNNRNRTVAEVKTIFDKNGGKLGERGSVAYLFEAMEGGGYRALYPVGEGSEAALLEALANHNDVQEVYTT